MKKVIISAVLAVTALGLSSTAQADVFAMPNGQTSVQFVTVGDAGNQASPYFSAGSVAARYQMGKYDVTAGQYCQFLNSVATTSDPYGLYSTQMGFGLIAKNGSSYSVMGGHENFPVTSVSWGDAARFCNWLTNGQPVGGETLATTEDGSYFLNGATTDAPLNAVSRKSGPGHYYIPTLSEWYKAAYYKGGSTAAGYWQYPTRTNATPSNIMSASGTNNANFYAGGYTDPTNYLTPVGFFAASPSPYGAYDMGGDVSQWTESTTWFAGQELRIFDGGDFLHNANNLAYNTIGETVSSMEQGTVGFRISAPAVPEPALIGLLAASSLGLLTRRRSPRR